MLNLDDFYRARYVLGKVIRRTDLIAAPKINTEGGIFLKPENLQVTGSFKLRGACYKISQLGDEEKAKGVIACSAGNHAQGVALSATRRGIKSVICMPAGAPISKVEATKSYGGEVVLVPGVYDDAANRAVELMEEKGYTYGISAMLIGMRDGVEKEKEYIRSLADGVSVGQKLSGRIEKWSGHFDLPICDRTDFLESIVLYAPLNTSEIKSETERAKVKTFYDMRHRIEDVYPLGWLCK